MKIFKIDGFGQIDYPGKLASVVVSPKCNYRCPACHSPEIVNGDANIEDREFFKYLESQKKWLDGVVLCGGEPTIQPGIFEFARKIKDMGFAIKLDTNGSHYAILRELLEDKVIDYVAMDVKGPTELYNNLTGKQIDPRDNLYKAISIVSQFPGYEFRTTVVPVIRDDAGSDISFLTPDEIAETAKMICENTQSNKHSYYLQRFVPRKDGLLDRRLESFPETPLSLLEEMLGKARVYLPRTEIRA
jgi:pyruvate formate lyase activating enzyme